MANQRRNGKKEYDFGYFERMNQKSSDHAGPKTPPASRNPRTPPSPSMNSRAQRNAAAQRNRQAAARQEGTPERYRQGKPDGKPRMPAGKPPVGTRPADSHRDEKSKKKPQPDPRKSQPPRAKKPPKPPKPPKPKKPKPSLTPEQVRKRRRRNRILFTLSLIFAVVIAGVILSLTVLFHVTEIVVTGESRYTQEEIVQASHLATGGNLFTTDTSGAAGSIEETLPYIGSVKVVRKLPGTLLIQVEDIVVAGAVQYGDGYLVLGSNGKALEQVPYLPEGCPSIVGAKLSQAEIGKVVEYADEEQKQLIETMSLAAEENELEDITQIDVSDPYNVKMVYNGRITLKFGLPTDLDYKIRFAQSVIDSEISSTDRGTLDLSLARDLSKVYFEPDYTVPDSSTSAVSQPPVASASSAVSSASSPAA